MPTREGKAARWRYFQSCHWASLLSAEAPACRLRLDQPDAVVLAPSAQGLFGRAVFEVVPLLEPAAGFEKLFETAIGAPVPEKPGAGVVIVG